MHSLPRDGGKRWRDEPRRALSIKITRLENRAALWWCEVVGRPGRKSEELSELRPESDTTNFRLEINNISGTAGHLTVQCSRPEF